MIIPGELLVAMQDAERIERARVERLDSAAERLFLAENPGGAWFLTTAHQRTPWRLRAREAA